MSLFRRKRKLEEPREKTLEQQVAALYGGGKAPTFRSQTGRGKPSTHSKRLKPKRKLGRR